MKKTTARLRQLRHGQQGYEQTESDPAAEGAEDEDVQEERLAVQAGSAMQCQCKRGSVLGTIPACSITHTLLDMGLHFMLHMSAHPQPQPHEVR